MKFRKKPVVIEAFKWSGSLADVPAVCSLWVAPAWEAGKLFMLPEQHEDALLIKTLNGTVVALVGDWIIQGVDGELCPCKPDIFDQTYEQV